ncbi:DUF4279 domain-containing protein [Sphingobium yanoikuyae]|uniref:DUF4279 domain-containing protein n=1 Tax=Sphingobium yanoikuyae TaxID=13690 RepID=UPI00241D3600|nr:DUF4279 domain-containing protein [Sphingobium yanoikuyae]
MLGSDMGVLHRSAASIGFYGDDLDPTEITERLGEPTIAVKMGGTFQTLGGRDKIARTGSWQVTAKDQQPADLDRQINDLLDGLSDDIVSWQAFSQRFRSRVFCGLFLEDSNEGLALRSETLSRLGDRGLCLHLDIYSAPELG